jgi:excisionase family DNA binding protein
MAAKAASRKPNRPATITAAAEYAPCGRRTIQRYIHQGKLTAWRLGPKMIRVDLDEIDQLFRRIPGTGDAA